MAVSNAFDAAVSGTGTDEAWVGDSLRKAARRKAAAAAAVVARLPPPAVEVAKLELVAVRAVKVEAVPEAAKLELVAVRAVEVSSYVLEEMPK